MLRRLLTPLLRRSFATNIGDARAAQNTAPHNHFDATPKLSDDALKALSEERVSDECDVLIVGGGPAGLSAAIRAKQAGGDKVRVVLLEKAAEIGAHSLSGAVIEPTGLDQLFGANEWREMGAPLNTACTRDALYFLPNATSRVRLPEVPMLHNRGNYIGSLGLLCRWLGEQAEALGVEIFAGFPAAQLVIDAASGAVRGVATADVGIAKDGSLKPSFERGMELHAKFTLLAEGARGSLTQEAEARYGLRDGGVAAQTYGIGLKEVWRVDADKHELGRVLHTVGWPIANDTWGGAFLYHWDEQQVSIGYVVGLDYANPYLNPYLTFQQWKTHAMIRRVLEGGECVAYGARALNEGGFQAIPRLVFPGGALVGCAAGFLNVPKIKGNHNAMKTGMMAGDAAAAAVLRGEGVGGGGGGGEDALLLREYEAKVKSSEVWSEMKAVRNFRPSYTTALGNYGGFLYSAFSGFVSRGREPWTLSHRHADNESLKPASQCAPIEYPKPDNKLTFDLLTNVSRTNTNHDDDQMSHLRVHDATAMIADSYKEHGGAEARFCPAGVYEWLEDEATGEPRLQINAQNCIHCKTCTIKSKYIRWTVPQAGGEGPAYGAM